MTRVVNGDQRQAVRWSSDASPGAIAACEYLRRPVHGLLTPPYLGKRSRDIPHHVLQESIGGDVEDYPVPVPRDIDGLDLTYRR